MQPAQLKLDAPNLAAEWASWLEDWELYLTGSGLDGKPETTQRAVRQHWMGPEARIKLKGFSLTADERNDQDAIKRAFAAYCQPVANEVIERYQFWQLTPTGNESIDAFVATLRAKANNLQLRPTGTTNDKR